MASYLCIYFYAWSTERQDETPDGPNVENPFDHLLHQALLEKTNKGGHSGHIYCYLPECVFMHILLFVVEVLVDIAPCNKEKT